MADGNMVDLPEVEGEAAVAKDSLLQIPPIDIEHREELYKAAYEHILDTRIGKFESAPRWRFEQQIFAEMRLLHGDELKTLFDEADSNFRKVRGLVSGLRLTSAITVSLFFVSFVFLQKSLAGGLAAADLTMVIGTAATCVLLSIGNAINRKFKLSDIQQLASNFGGVFNRNIMALRTKVHRAFDQIRNDGATSDGCGERAAKWNHIAFWLDDLRVAYDRYVTTHVWRTRTRMRWMRTALVAFTMFAVLAGFVASVAFGGVAGLSLAACGAAAILLVLGWDFGVGSKGAADVWVETFDDAVTGQSAEERRDHHSTTRSSHVLQQIRDREYQNAVVN